ncbi:MAG TPA: methylmalonyl-CoA epimerase [Candidatus Coatesbacteria bacterium]|nr:methylmalonyl-CoA epimerase [Candidatus Coatesbacteria bacterium]
MKVIKISHIGIAVEDLAGALELWEKALGLKVEGTEAVPSMSLKTAKLRLGEADVELLESTDPEGPVGRFIAARGPGIHHLCVEVEDMVEALAELKGAGYRLLDEKPRVGAGGAKIAFVHPKSCGGVLLELTERPR